MTKGDKMGVKRVHTPHKGGRDKVINIRITAADKDYLKQVLGENRVSFGDILALVAKKLREGTFVLK